MAAARSFVCGCSYPFRTVRIDLFECKTTMSKFRQSRDVDAGMGTVFRMCGNAGLPTGFERRKCVQWSGGITVDRMWGEV